MSSLGETSKVQRVSERKLFPNYEVVWESCMAFLCSHRAALHVDVKIFLCRYFQQQRLSQRSNSHYIITGKQNEQRTKQAGLHSRFTDSTFSICQCYWKTVPVLARKLSTTVQVQLRSNIFGHCPASSLVLQVVPMSFRCSCLLLSQRVQKPKWDKALLSSTPKWSQIFLSNQGCSDF